MFSKHFDFQYMTDIDKKHWDSRRFSQNFGLNFIQLYRFI